MRDQEPDSMLATTTNLIQGIYEMLPAGSDRAGVNIAIEYVMSVAVFIALIGALTAGFSSTIDTSEENVAQVELTQTSHEVAVAIEDVDRLVERWEQKDAALPGGAGEVKSQIRVDLPERAGAAPYVIRVNDSAVIAETDVGTGIEAESVTEYDTTADVEVVGGVSGGSIIIRYNTGASEIEVDPVAE